MGGRGWVDEKLVLTGRTLLPGFVDEMGGWGRSRLQPASPQGFGLGAVPSRHRPQPPGRSPITSPVACTRTYTGKSGIPARVFFTTLGHPYDFKLEPMRKLALGGIFWGAWRTKYPPMASR